MKFLLRFTLYLQCFFALSVVGCRLVSTVPTARSAPGEPVVDVYILAGQSNMEGRAHQRDLPEVLRAPNPAVWFYHEDAWGPLAPGSSKCPAPPDGFGPEIGFAVALARVAPGKFALIKHAVGGTSLAADWRAPDGPQTVRLLAKVRAALAEFRQRRIEYRVSGFIWVQGERDANERDPAAAYAAGLAAYIRHMRRELAAPTLPFVVARITPHSMPARAFSEVVRAAQASVCRATPHTHLVDTDDLTLFEEPAPDGSRVRVHFDASSLVRLGERLANAALAVDGRVPVISAEPASSAWR